MEKARMTQADQAVLLWPMLALAARTQQILSYAAVEGFTGIARHGLNHALGLIHDYCKRHSFPPLNVIVVNQETGLPGEGFPETMTPMEIKVEQGRVFVFDWSGHDKPRSQDFQSA
jgi:putative restriction endonuclease